MADRLGGNAPYILNEVETPIAYRAGQFFNTSDDRLSQAGGGLEGYVTITQDNLSAIIGAIAELERKVSALSK